MIHATIMCSPFVTPDPSVEGRARRSGRTMRIGGRRSCRRRSATVLSVTSSVLENLDIFDRRTLKAYCGEDIVSSWDLYRRAASFRAIGPHVFEINCARLLIEIQDSSFVSNVCLGYNPDE